MWHYIRSIEKKEEKKKEKEKGNDITALTFPGKSMQPNEHQRQRQLLANDHYLRE